jgi:hypothetical protein
MPTISWNGGSGSWTDAENWTPQQVPVSSDDAAIAGSSPSDVLIGGSDSVAVSDLFLDDTAGTLEVDALLTAGTITLTAGVINDDGTIANATLINDGGTLDFGYGLLYADTVQGALVVGSTGTAVVQGGLTVQNEDGSSPGTVTINGADSTLLFNDTETFDNATVVIGSADGLDGLDAGGTLTLGQGVLVETTSAFLSDSLGGNGTIINNGSILADATSGTMSLESPSFINNGGITVTDGADLQIQPFGTFANNGSLSISQGGTIAIQFLTAFTNTGSIQIGTGSELDLDTYPSALTQMQASGGTVEIDGILNAGGNTIDVDATGAFSTLDNFGTIENATLVLDGGTLGLDTSVFQNDTIQGALTIGDGNTVVVQDGFTVENADGSAPGTIALTGADATFEVADDETLDNATITMGNASDLDTLQVDGTLTLGTASAIETTPSFASAAITGAGTVINDGKVTADASSGNLVIGTTDFTNAGLLTISGGAGLQIQTFDAFQNTGTLSVTSGSLATVEGTSALANSGAIVVDGGTLVVDAPLQGGNQAAAAVATQLEAAGGTTTLSDDAEVELGASSAAGQTIHFLDGTDRLILDDATAFASDVNGFQSGDSIVLSGFAGATETYADGVLTLTQSATVLGIPITNTATIQLEGNYTASDFSTTSETDGSLLITTDVVPCFASGTRILTAEGEVAVEALKVGDSVVTVTGGRRRLMPITWIGLRAIDIGRHPAPEKVRPIRVQRGAFAPNQPSRDLLLSPDHAIYDKGVLVPVKYLVNGTTVAEDGEMRSVVYHHIQLEQHEILLAEGLPAESYLESGGRGMFVNGGQPVTLHADFSHIVWDVLGCAPLMVTGPEVESIRGTLAKRAASARRRDRKGRRSGVSVSQVRTA